MQSPKSLFSGLLSILTPNAFSTAFILTSNAPNIELVTPGDDVDIIFSAISTSTIFNDKLYAFTNIL